MCDRDVARLHIIKAQNARPSEIPSTKEEDSMAGGHWKKQRSHQKEKQPPFCRPFVQWLMSKKVVFLDLCVMKGRICRFRLSSIKQRACKMWPPSQPQHTPKNKSFQGFERLTSNIHSLPSTRHHNKAPLNPRHSQEGMHCP